MFSFVDLLRYGSLRREFIVLALLFFFIAVQLYAPAMLISEMKFNIHLLGLLNGLSQVLTIPFCLVMVVSYSRRKAQIIVISCSTILMLILYVLIPNGCFSCVSQPVMIVCCLVLYFGTRFCSNLSSNLFSPLLNQTFPAQLNSTAIYSILAFGRLATIMIPYLPEIRDKWHFPLLLIFTLVGILGVITSFFIK